MPEMDQSRLTTEELATCQALDEAIGMLRSRGTRDATELADAFADCLRSIRRLAGDKPPADRIRCAVCGEEAFVDPCPRCYAEAVAD